MLARFVALFERHPDRGATAVEYSLMVAFIAMAIIFAVRFLGTSLGAFFTYAAAAI